MAKEQQVQVRIYKREHGILRRLAFRKSLKEPTTIADIIRLLVKGV